MPARTDSAFPLHFLLFSLLWSSVLRASPPNKGEKILGLVHAVLVTATSLRCIFYRDDTALSCAASVAFFAVDAVGMALGDGLLRGGGKGGGGRGDGTTRTRKTTKFGSLHVARKMDYAHHALGVIFGTIQHYWERDFCHPSVGNAFVYVQWNEISTPFYNLFRLTQSPAVGMIFAVTFFLSRVVGNTVVVIPLLYGNCSSVLGVFCAPYFLLQYIWFYMIAAKMMEKVLGRKKGGVGKESAERGAAEKKLD